MQGALPKPSGAAYNATQPGIFVGGELAMSIGLFGFFAGLMVLTAWQAWKLSRPDKLQDKLKDDHTF